MTHRLVAACSVLALALAWSGAPAHAQAAPVEVGWWTSNPAASAPADGVAVSARPDGAVTVAAVRVSVAFDTIESATLTLTEAGGVQQSGAQLQVCPTPNAWKPGPKQAMAQAPKAECEVVKAPLTRGADGSWKADVRAVLSSSSAGDESSPSLMIVPVGAGAVPVGFEVRFAKPVVAVTGTSDDDGFSSSSPSTFERSEAGSAAADGSGASSAPGGPSSAPAPLRPSAGLSPTPSSSSAQLSGTFEGAPTAADPPAAAVVDEARADATATAPASARPVRVASVNRPASGSRTGQALFFVALATVVGVLVGLAHWRFRPDGASIG